MTETLDAICGGELTLLQPEGGYRFNIDSVLLAGFCAGDAASENSLRVADLGAGCGIVALLLKRWRPAWSVQAVELQEAVAALAARNATANALDVDVVTADWQAWRPGEGARVDLVVSNPPYQPVGRGKLPDREDVAISRFEVKGTLGSLFAAARRGGTDRVVVRVIFPAERIGDVFQAAEASGMRITTLRFVHAFPGDGAYAVLVEARAGDRRPLCVAAPLIVNDREKRYSDEVLALLSRR